MKRYLSILEQWWEGRAQWGARIEHGAYHVGRVLFWAGLAALALLFLGLAIALLVWLLSTYPWHCLGAIVGVAAACCISIYYNKRWPVEGPSDLAWGPDVDPPNR